MTEADSVLAAVVGSLMYFLHEEGVVSAAAAERYMMDVFPKVVVKSRDLMRRLQEGHIEGELSPQFVKDLAKNLPGNANAD